MGESKTRAVAAGGLDEAQQQPDERGLAGPVGTDEADDPTAGDLEIELPHRHDVAEATRELVGTDDGHVHLRPNVSERSHMLVSERSLVKPAVVSLTASRRPVGC